MKIQPTKIPALIKELDEVISVLVHAEEEHYQEIAKVHPSYRDGARNLIHYRTFRSLNLKRLQKRLSYLGLSMLGSTESHVLATLINSQQILKSLIREKDIQSTLKGTSIKSSVKQQKRHAKDLFGHSTKGRRVRIMVTLPTEAAYDYKLVHDLLASGMNTARINCAHDGPEVWLLMIQNLHQAKSELKKDCKVFMDLAGPKIRTGSFPKGAKVRKFRPKKNELGEVIQPVSIELVSGVVQSESNALLVDFNWLKSLKEGDSITFKDTRKKRRTLFVSSVQENRVIATCRKTCYVQTGTVLTCISSLTTSTVGDLPAREESILLRKSDHLKILKNEIEGKPAEIDETGSVTSCAMISCTASEIFDAVKQGERILFDDGKIEGVVKEVTGSEMLIKILRAKVTGTKLKADKGINLPDTELNLSGLTSKDKEDLRFVVQNADAVNVSFINSASDVIELFGELEKLGASKDLGVVLKIENQRAYENIIEILLAGMQRYPTGVMIARGDLAIETGWENMPRIQNELLRLCNSAYVPTVWATQVLENLAKNGVPSRSELTDAASSLKADCVMLNKGPYILNALNLLHTILFNMNSYRDKDVRMFEAIEPTQVPG